MKKCLSVITLFLSAVFTLLSYEFFEQFDLRRLTANFYGLCFNQTTLLVYGDGGIILRTTDWGKNWQQISLNDSLCTIDMVYVKNKFFGISRFQYTIVSTDDGLTWTLKDFGKSTRFYKLFLIDSSLIVVTRGKILIYDENLTLSKEIEIPKKEGFYRDEYLDKISLVNDYFLFQYSSNEMCLLSLKDGTYQIFKVSFPQNTTIRKIIPHSDGVFLYLGNESFYEFNLGNRELTYLGTLPPAFSRVFSSFGNDIYMMCNYYDNRFNVDSLSFGKFRNNSTFENINPVVDRYICQLNFTDIKFKNQDTIIAVGLYKLIMISSDGGRNWVLHSLFNFERRFCQTFPEIFLFKGKYLRTLGNYLSFFSSNDTGTTWLPPKPIKIDFKENGNFLSVSSRIGTYLTEEKGFYFADVLYIKEPNLAFTADGGDSFFLDTNLSIGNSNSFAGPHLMKYKNYYLFVTSGKLRIKGKWMVKNFFRKIDITPEGLKFETVSIDSSVQFIFIHNVNDTLYAVVQKELDNYFTDTLFVYASYDGAITWDSLYPIFIKRRTTKPPYIRSFLEYGNAFLVSVAFEKDIYDSFNNSVESIYYLNFQERFFKEIVPFSSDTIINPIETKVGKYYLIYGIFRTNQTLSNKILFTKNFVTPINEWKELSLNPRYVQGDPLLIFYIFSNDFYGFTRSLPVVKMEENTLLIRTVDNYHRTPVIFLAKLKPNSILWADSIKTDSLDMRNFELYVTQPYPIPTNENVNFRVYFNPDYNFEQIELFVTDVVGRIVAENNAFVKIPLTNHSIEVRGRLDNLSQGVYFVIVRLHDTTKEIPIVIIK